jgi:hypothetical protein
LSMSEELGKACARQKKSGKDLQFWFIPNKCP